MKTIMLSLLVLGVAGAALAIEPAQLDNRIRELSAKFEALQLTPDKGIPAETLRKAQGLILLDRTKAGFIFAYQGGGGVALVKDAAGRWSPAAFVGAHEASLGFQVGGEKDFYVLLLMTSNANRFLTDPNYDIGGEARGTAGNASSGYQGKFASYEPPVMIFDNRKGLYGGADLKAGAISPDDKANRLYYGKMVTMKDILFDHQVQPTDAALDLAKTINQYSQVRDDFNTARK